MKNLGDGWGEYQTEGRVYYYNVITREKSWKPPRKKLSSTDSAERGSKESLYSNHSSTGTRSNSSSPLIEHSNPSLNRSNISLNSSPISSSLNKSLLSISNSRTSLNDRSNSRSSLNDTSNSRETLSVKSISRNSLDNRSNSEDDILKKLPEPSSILVPQGWKEAYDSEADQRCFINTKTGQKWYSSNDSEGRVYFFEENSNESTWTLPEITNKTDREQLSSFYSLQKSSTESAINQQLKLRPKKNEGKERASVRSFKAQSMVLDPKFEFNRDNSALPRNIINHNDILKFGPLNKTKVMENGKKTRKHWALSYVILTRTALYIFKENKIQDYKTQTSINLDKWKPELKLEMKDMKIEKGNAISSKKNAYKISTPACEILCQCDRDEIIMDWMRQINDVNLSILSNNPVLLTSTYQECTRSPSVKVKGKDCVVEEDVPPGVEGRSRIKDTLRKFFLLRVSKDDLVTRGIWKDEPVFGRTLEDITKSLPTRIPPFVDQCIRMIESKEDNMKTDGLYRVSGNLSQVQKIRLEVDQNKLCVLEHEEDVHVLTGSLKLFFRELKEPVIPFRFYKKALDATNTKNKEKKHREIKQIVKDLPRPNFETLKCLLQHLLRVTKYKEFNRMHIPNLAIVFGPTLMWPEQDSYNMAIDLMQQNQVVECLLEEFSAFF